MTSTPNVAGPRVLDSPTPTLSAVERPGARGDLLRAGVPEEIEVRHLMRHREAVLEDECFQRLPVRPFLQGTEANIHVVPELFEVHAAGVEEVHAGEPGVPGSRGRDGPERKGPPPARVA